MFFLGGDCERIGGDTVGSMIEICDNGIDDDNDGFIDFYDEDCECSEELFNAQCEIECEQEPDSSSVLDVQLKWMSPLINDSRFASPANLVIDDNSNIFITTLFELDDSLLYRISILNGNSGQLISDIPFDSSEQSITYNLAISRSEFDNEVKIFTKTSSGLFYCKNIDGSTNWINDQFVDDFRSLSSPRIADINEDGTSELYAGNIILNSETGNILYVGEYSKGCNFTNVFDTCSTGAQSVAADFTPQDGLELIAGNVMYEVNLINLNDTTGNTSTVTVAPEPVKEGLNGFGDFDADGFLDVVIVRSDELGDGGVWIWNPRSNAILAQAGSPKGLDGGEPTVVDLNNDCVPEIIVAYQRRIHIYAFDGSNTLGLVGTIETTENSGFNSTTVFDFYNDGYPEIIYRDMDRFRIFDGVTLEVLYNTQLFGGTLAESPIITDVDDDGHAEILIHGGLEDQDSLRVFCYESASIPWAPARKVWNQSGYHVTNVNDDLTIPQYQQSSAAFFDTDSCFLETCPQVYNTFGVQATYRTQKGCVVLEEREVMPVEITASQDSVCFRDSVVFDIITEENEILWIANGEELVSCTDCDSIKVSLDTTSWVTVLAGDGRCYVEDSILIYVNEPIEIIQFDSICQGDSILFDGIYRKSSGVYQSMMNGCDSVFILNLEVLSSLEESILRFICPGGSIEIEGEVFDLEGVYQIETVSNEDCDSLINLTIEMYETSIVDTTFSICDGDSVLVEGVWYDQVEFISLENPNENGCDSTTMVSIEVVDILNDQDTLSICQGDSILIHGEWQYEGGNYPDLFQAESGCDSVFTYHLIVNDSPVVDVERTICQGDTFFINDIILTEPTFYTYITESSLLCDSTVNLSLFVDDLLTRSIDLAICEGDSVSIEGAWIMEADTIEVIKTNSSDCDSLLTYTITVVEINTIYDEIEACAGDSIDVNGEVFYSDTLLIDTLTGLECPTLRRRNLVFNPTVAVDTAIVLCEGDSLLFLDSYILTSGNYFADLSTSQGCDSMVNLSVEISSPMILLPTDTIVSQGELISFSILENSGIDDNVWSSFDFTLDCMECATTTFMASSSGVINVELMDTTGCFSSFVIYVAVEEANEEIPFPNIFSPNGDDINDTWNIDLANYPQNELFVYDRWGNKVAYWQNELTINWDGSTNGNRLSDGVYVYVLAYSVDGDRNVKVGNITLVQ